MAWCHGLEKVSFDFLDIVLIYLKIDRNNITKRDQSIFRQVYFDYKLQFCCDGARRVNESTNAEREDLKNHFDFDYTNIEFDDDDAQVAFVKVCNLTPQYPICLILPCHTSVTKTSWGFLIESDPLVLMSMRSRTMAFEFVRLLMDLSSPDDERKSKIKCVSEFFFFLSCHGHQEDIPQFLQLMASPLAPERERFQCLLHAFTIGLFYNIKLGVSQVLHNYDVVRRDLTQYRLGKAKFAEEVARWCVTNFEDKELVTMEKFQREVGKIDSAFELVPECMNIAQKCLL